MGKEQDIRKVIDLLEKEYGSPRHGNPLDPLDDLLYLKLSQQTNAVKFTKVFQNLKRRGWDWILAATEAEVAAELRYIGFHHQRAAQLRAMLAQIQVDRAGIELSWLRSVSTDDAIAYLTSLPGVGVKTAYCVAMYTLNASVLPVDTHVGRLGARLGYMPEAKEYKGKRVHQALEAVIPPEKRYSFHVNAVAHGRAVCTTSRPRCGECVLREYCSFYRMISSETAVPNPAVLD